MVDIYIWLKFISFICTIAVIIFIIFQTDWFQVMKSGEFDLIVKENLFFTMIITLLIMIIQNTFTIIPLILVITVNYTLFGFVNGFLWSWFTSIIGAVLIFMGSRYLFQGWIIKKTNKELLSKIEKSGLLFVFQARIMPFIPTSLINILGGISSIHFKSFIIGTVFGNFIYFFLLTLIPAGLMITNLNDYILEGVILMSIALYLIYKKKWKRKKETVADK
ncbi:TVP38/TMEM64 family protein [Bacillus sp. V3B]|uniref:TVP38/TMEM64 family protein n=1 Tax=Bacillus sp. V3B TaxID=2804915 RepID=UPI00210E0968|nr:VTT domain-containing protein [Bacillus sp. V3B]MCQ6274924.1 TVP38/TMEM64 family protein [Bacillus sp. V3B]